MCLGRVAPCGVASDQDRCASRVRRVYRPVTNLRLLYGHAAGLDLPAAKQRNSADSQSANQLHNR